MAMSLEVKQNDNGSFTVEWDKKDPNWMFLNQLTQSQKMKHPLSNIKGH